MKNYYKISEISKLYGIGPDALRYYEKIGILTPKRDTNGYRLYNLKDVYKLNVIRDLRKLDFPVAVIKEYLDCQSIENTLSLLHEEESLLCERVRELRTRQEAIKRRIAFLDGSMSVEADTVHLKDFPERKCVKLSERITRDEEMDVVIKKLHRKHELNIPEIGNLEIGAFMSREGDEPGKLNVFLSVFFVLEEDTADCDFSLPQGKYLSCFYRGNYSGNYRCLSRIDEYSKQMNLQIGEPFEIYKVDNRYTSRTKEYLTEMQVQVLRDC